MLQNAASLAMTLNTTGQQFDQTAFYRRGSSHHAPHGLRPPPRRALSRRRLPARLSCVLRVALAFLLRRFLPPALATTLRSASLIATTRSGSTPLCRRLSLMLKFRRSGGGDERRGRLAAQPAAEIAAAEEVAAQAASAEAKGGARQWGRTSRAHEQRSRRRSADWRRLRLQNWGWGDDTVVADCASCSNRAAAALSAACNIM